MCFFCQNVSGNQCRKRLSKENIEGIHFFRLEKENDLLTQNQKITMLRRGNACTGIY